MNPLVSLDSLDFEEVHWQRNYESHLDYLLASMILDLNIYVLEK